MSALWDPLFGRSDLAAQTSDAAWVRALCDVEAALATACAGVGLIDMTTARRVGEVCAAWGDDADPTALGALATADGNPVVALVRALRSAAGLAAPAVHLGATSQDILDTAAMLVAQRAMTPILAALSAAEGACGLLAAEHRDTEMAGRTLLQQAVPTTFGALAAGWGQGLVRATAGLSAVRAGLAVQLGGAAGTLAGWYPHGPQVRAAFAAELGLVDPMCVWHTERSRIAGLAGALGTACGVVGKVATDVVLLAQTELGELGERAGGSSSTMAHKHNPVAAITARANAAQAPGLVATLLAAMPAELQRGAGPWHAEWPALTALLMTTGGAASRLATSLTDLVVDREALQCNRDRLDPIATTGHAGDLVDDYLQARR